MKLKKNKAEAKVALLSEQPSFLNVARLTELLLKELPSKFNDLTEEVKGLKKHVHELEIDLLGDLKDIPNKLETFTLTIESLTTQAKLALNLLRGKNTNQVTISQLFQRKAAKDAKKANLNKQQSILTPLITNVTSSTTSSLISPFLPSPPKSSSQPKGEHIKKDKGKKAMSSKDAEEEGS
ncbi:hypothetical protein Tco_1549339 [Tanacetum coccineum]